MSRHLSATVTVATAAILALVAAACGSGTGSGKASTGSGKGCDSSNPVKIGVVLSISGVYAGVGGPALDQVKVGAKAINAAGGILGRCVSLVTKDDQGTPSTSVSDVQALIQQDHVSGIVGPLLSTNTAAVLNAINSSKILEASYGSPPAALNPKQSPYTYVFGVSAPQGAGAFATCISGSKLKSFGILAVNNALGTDYVNAIKPFAQKEGLKITGTQFFNGGAVSVIPQLTSLKSGNPDALVLFNTGSDITTALKGRQQLNWNVPVVGFSTVTQPSVIKAMGITGMHGVYGSGYSPSLQHSARSSLPADGVGKAYVKAMQGYYHENPLKQDASNAAGYDAVQFIAHAFNAVHSLDSVKAAHYIDSHGYKGVSGTYDFSSSTHQGLTAGEMGCVSASSFKNGTYKLTNAIG